MFERLPSFVPPAPYHYIHTHSIMTGVHAHVCLSVATLQMQLSRHRQSLGERDELHADKRGRHTNTQTHKHTNTTTQGTEWFMCTLICVDTSFSWLLITFTPAAFEYINAMKECHSHAKFGIRASFRFKQKHTEKRERKRERDRVSERLFICSCHSLRKWVTMVFVTQTERLTFIFSFSCSYICINSTWLSLWSDGLYLCLPRTVESKEQRK